MKKIIALLLIVLTTLTLSSCFLFGRTPTHPDMVEYTEEEILEVAKDKYGITEWIFTGTEIRGEAWYDAEGVFKLKFYEEYLSTDFTNGNNIEAAMQAFAGKNGGHDIQGMYSHFLCCVALGECADGSLKFVYYNTNIHKDAKIADTIGASDYTFEVLPTEITNDLFTVDSRWTDMQLFLNEYKNGNPREFVYSGERLTRRRNEKYNSYVEFEFYKENNKVVYDVYYTKDEYKPEERRLVYSTSDRYGVIYNYYGANKTQYFNITQTVAPSDDESNVMELWGYVETKPIDGTVIYSNIGYRAKYQVMSDGKIIEHNSSDNAYDTLNFKRGYGIDMIDGVDHTETAKFTVYDYYILYERNAETE